MKNNYRNLRTGLLVWIVIHSAESSQTLRRQAKFKQNRFRFSSSQAGILSCEESEESAENRIVTSIRTVYFIHIACPERENIDRVY
jgi:hypothetical protein